MPGDELTLGDGVRRLGEGTLEVVAPMPWASNATFLAVVRHAGGELPVVYKPRRGERPLWDFPAGTLHLREVAAYEVSEALGWLIVPTTVLRDGPLGEGMVQAFVEHDPEEHYLTLRERFADRLRLMAAFDAVVNNADRKAGHCLRDAEDHLWGIDHGVTFHVEPKLRTVIWDFAGEPVPAAILEDLSRLGDALGRELGDRLALLLSSEETTALRERVTALIRSAAFPHPSGPRPVPWPYL